MKKAFTITVALVCVAIISILAALLLPALSRAKAKADAIKSGQTNQPPIMRTISGTGSTYGAYDTAIIQDRETGVEYIVTYKGGITPRIKPVTNAEAVK